MAARGRELYDQGVACERAGDVAGAFEAFRLSIKAQPQVAAPYIGLSRLLMRNHQRMEAITCLEQACRHEPANPMVHTILGRALVQDGQVVRGRQCFETALRLKPDARDASLGLGGALEDLGDRALAAHVYRGLLDRSPTDAEGLAGLLGVVDKTGLDEAVRLARAFLSEANDRDCALVGYALGKVLAREGQHSDAFSAWTSANAARRQVAGPFDRGAFDKRIDQLIEIFSAAFFSSRRGWGAPSERPIFVVGLPRSGTTLTEQILASHSGVFGAGELDLLTDMATGTPDRLGRADPPWPESALELSRAHATGIAQDHLARLSKLAPDAIRIIDKQPLNFWHLGLVAITFPNARIVHCTRDLRDNGLSIFAENFTPEQRWATDLSDIAHYWCGYRRLVAHWKSVSGLEILDVAYEDLIADLEGQARQLADFVGLSWDPAMLEFHRADRAVQTPSRWQVRRPLYASSAGRWRHYEPQLAPLSIAVESRV